VKVARVAVGVADGRTLVNCHRLWPSLLAVVVEHRAARLVEEAPGRVSVVVGEAKTALAVTQQERVVRCSPQLVALKAHHVPVRVRGRVHVAEDSHTRESLPPASRGEPDDLRRTHERKSPARAPSRDYHRPEPDVVGCRVETEHEVTAMAPNDAPDRQVGRRSLLEVREQLDDARLRARRSRGRERGGDEYDRGPRSRSCHRVRQSSSPPLRLLVKTTFFPLALKAGAPSTAGSAVSGMTAPEPRSRT
jgi:hypothetical protein